MINQIALFSKHFIEFIKNSSVTFTLTVHPCLVELEVLITKTNRAI